MNGLKQGKRSNHIEIEATRDSISFEKKSHESNVALYKSKSNSSFKKAPRDLRRRVNQKKKEQSSSSSCSSDDSLSDSSDEESDSDNLDCLDPRKKYNDVELFKAKLKKKT
jgi:hypothetical protein